MERRVPSLDRTFLEDHKGKKIASVQNRRAGVLRVLTGRQRGRLS